MKQTTVRRRAKGERKVSGLRAWLEEDPWIISSLSVRLRIRDFFFFAPFTFLFVEKARRENFFFLFLWILRSVAAFLLHAWERDRKMIHSSPDEIINSNWTRRPALFCEPFCHQLLAASFFRLFSERLEYKRIHRLSALDGGRLRREKLAVGD